MSDRTPEIKHVSVELPADQELALRSKGEVRAEKVLRVPIFKELAARLAQAELGLRADTDSRGHIMLTPVSEARGSRHLDEIFANSPLRKYPAEVVALAKYYGAKRKNDAILSLMTRGMSVEEAKEAVNFVLRAA